MADFSPKRDLTDNSRGFTLVEVLAAVCVLSLGIVMIFTSLFSSMEQARYASDYKVLAPWLEERLWDAQDNLTMFGPQMAFSGGQLELDGRSFNWSTASSQVAGLNELFQIDASLAWRDGKRQKIISRSMYAFYEAEEEDDEGADTDGEE